MSEKDIALLSIKDFLTLKMLKYSLMPLVVSLVVMYILFFVLAGVWVDELSTLNVQSTQTTIENGIPHTQSMDAKLEGSAIIQFLMSYAITSWLATFLIYAIGGFLTIYASIFVAIIIVGFLTPFILKELQTRHYRDVEMIGHSNAIYTVFLALKWAAAMFLLFILLIPFYLIPFINIIAINIPLYYFFHKMLKFDISSNIATADEDKQISFFTANRLRVKTLALYLLSLIPFMIFFAAVFYVIYLGHTYFIEVKKIRNI
ncbi:MAG: EI24 domain-containing protein [Sulfurimonas sp.]